MCEYNGFDCDNCDYIEKCQAEQDAENRPFLRLVTCQNCNGTGTITYNPNLNPNLFPGIASAKCTRCNGSGCEEGKP